MDGILCFPLPLDRARSDFVDRDDARVVERRRRLGLDDEAPQPLLVADELRWKNLERDASLEGEILREVHLAHPSGPERARDPKVGNSVARYEGVVHGGQILTFSLTTRPKRVRRARQPPAPAACTGDAVVVMRTCKCP